MVSSPSLTCLVPEKESLDRFGTLKHKIHFNSILTDNRANGPHFIAGAIQRSQGTGSSFPHIILVGNKKSFQNISLERILESTCQGMLQG